MIGALALALALQATSPPFVETRVSVAALMGLGPDAVAARLGAAGGLGSGDAIRLVDGARTLELYPASRFWRRTEGEACLTGFRGLPDETAGEDAREALLRRNGGLLVFEDGRLTGVHANPVRPDGPATREAIMAAVTAPRPPSPLTAEPGRLPLSDGGASLSRTTPAGELAVVSLCRRLPDNPARSGDVGTDIIWGMVGLVVLPTVPFTQAEQRRADREGGALLASAEPGAALPQGLEAFARRRGVRVYRDPADPDFAVLAVKLGPGDDNVADVGLVGVRGDRVVWKVERTAADRTGMRALMCRDARNRPGAHRPGCSSTGFLTP